MIFKTYNSETFARVFFNSYLFASLFLGFLGLITLNGFASEVGILLTLSGLFYIAIVSLLSLNKTFRRSPFSILLCFFTFLFLTIPVTFILIKGGDYIYGGGLASTPFPQSDYQESLPLGLLYLSVFWIATWLGIISAGTRKHEISQNRFSSIKLMPILLLGVIVMAVTWINNQNYIDVALIGAEKITSLLPLIFFDHAYLCMAGLILFFKLNESKCSADQRRITMLISVIFIGFIFTHYVSAGSKAAILIIFTFLVLYPLSYFREYHYALISTPTIRFLVILVLLSPPLFYIVLIQRVSLGSGIAPDSNTLLAGLIKVDASTIYGLSDLILYRLSWGELIDSY